MGRDRRVSKVKVIEGNVGSPWTKRAERAIENASRKPYLEFPQEARASERPLVAKVSVWEAEVPRDPDMFKVEPRVIEPSSY